MDAEFLRGLLSEQEIESTIQGQQLEEVWGAVPVSEAAMPSVWVNEADVERAKPIVEEYERRRIARVEAGDVPEKPTWTCPNCGEKIEEQFTACWHCNTNRPTVE